jgi:ABC-2 type transport system permease protein
MSWVETATRYLRAINAENIKEWKIELAYRADFVRQFVDPLLYALPYLFYGMALVGGRTSKALAEKIGSADVVTFITLGWILMGLLSTAIWAMGMAFRKEQWFGTLESVFAAPVPRWVYVMGMAFHSTLHQGMIIFFQLLIIHLIVRLQLNISGLLPALAMVALMMLALYGMGIMVAGMTLLFKEGWVVSELLHSIITVITPIAYPLAVMPVVLRKAALYVPTTYGITGVRHFLMGENLPWGLWGTVFWLLLLGIFWVAVGLSIFYAFDRFARRRGLLAAH